jgi:hypothetical protein
MFCIAAWAEMHYKFEYPKGKPLRLCAITHWHHTM